MKTNNPFKMWGSYLGALILAIPNIINLSGTYQTGQKYPLLVTLIKPFVGISMWIGKNLGGMGTNPLFNTNTPSITLFNIGAIVGAIITIAIGFLIGWAIHSLIRAIRK